VRLRHEKGGKRHVETTGSRAMAAGDVAGIMTINR